MTHELDWKSVVKALAEKGYVIVRQADAVDAGLRFFEEDN